MGINSDTRRSQKQEIQTIYAIAKHPQMLETITWERLHELFQTAADLAEYYEANERHLHEAEEKAMKRSDT